MAETSPKPVSAAAEVTVTEEQPQILDVPVDKTKLLVSPLKPHCDQDKPCDTAAASNGEKHQNGTEKTDGAMETSEEHHKETCDKTNQSCSIEEHTTTTTGSSDVATSPSEQHASEEQNGTENQATGNGAEQTTCDNQTEVPEKMVESPKTDTTTGMAENGTGCSSTTEACDKAGSPKASGESEGHGMEQEAAVAVHEKMVESPKAAAASSECSAL